VDELFLSFLHVGQYCRFCAHIKLPFSAIVSVLILNLKRQCEVILRTGHEINHASMVEKVEHSRREKRRQRGSNANVANAQVKKGKQYSHRLLFIPGKDQRER
jgi:hypothetical protein